MTIATNMAGRGTDIKLSDEVKAAGGLAIIGTERHDSRRVDRQLRGRSGRQGDPGSSQFYVSLEDDLMRLFQSERVSKMMDRMGHQEGEVIQHSMITKSIERAQKKVEENNFGVRKRLLEYDDVMNSQRRSSTAAAATRCTESVSSLTSPGCSTNSRTSSSASSRPPRTSTTCGFGRLNWGWTRPLVRTISNGSPTPRCSLCTPRPSSITATGWRPWHTHAHPVIQRVYEDDSNQFVNIAVPFTDGRRNMQVLANIHDAVDTSGTSLVDELEKSVVLGVLDQPEGAPAQHGRPPLQRAARPLRAEGPAPHLQV